MTVIVDVEAKSALLRLLTAKVPAPVLPCNLYVVAEVVAGESRKSIDQPQLLSEFWLYGVTVPKYVGLVLGWQIAVEFLTKLKT